jgi:hypothetical protein
MYRLLLLILGCVTCLIYRGFSQNIYVHTDRDNYQSTDTLWFKVYIFDSQTLQSAPDQTVYVQLVGNNKIVCTRTLLSVGGSAYNYIALADSLKGQYQLVAYTKAQLKQSDFLFRKNIAVSKNIFQEPDLQTDSTKIDIQFLPEGGHLVANLPIVVAFKATDANGNSVDIEGDILNLDNEEMTHFKVNFKGMGWLSFVPKINQKYKAKVVYNGKTYFFNFPKVEVNGVVMRVAHQEKDSVVTVRIYQSGQPFQHLKLQILARGRLYIELDLASKDVSIIKIAKSALPIGIVQLNVLADTVVLLERLVCANRKQAIDFQVVSTTKNPKFNEKIELDISASQNGKPVETKLSLSITDAAQLYVQNPKTNLFSHLFLQSDVHGYILEPAYYFDTTQAESYQRLDLLLLTQGWRKYRWNERMIEKTIETAPAIEGLVREYGTSKLSSDITLTYSYPNQIAQLKTDEKGFFRIENHGIIQNNQVYFQARKKAKDLYSITIFEQKIENLYQKLPTQSILQEKKQLQISPEIQKTVAIERVNANEKNYDLKEVVILGKTIQKQAVEQMIREIGLDPNAGIDLTMQDHYEVINDIPEVKSLNQLIQKKITEVHITTQFISLYGGQGEVVKFLAVPDSGPLGVTPVSIFLNKSIQCMLCLESRIESITAPSEIFKLIYIKAAANFIPTLILITKSSIAGYDYSKDKVVGSLTKSGLGFSSNKEFYSPKYENAKNNNRPDYRPTLYWNANIVTNKDGKATVTFYNSDIAKKLNIVVEGTDGLGNVGSGSFVVH